MALNTMLFLLAQLLHLLANAFYSAKNVNTKWKNVSHYLDTNFSKLLTQTVVSVGLYMVFLENPDVAGQLDLPWLKSLLSLHGHGAALVAGWFFDSVMDKVLGFWNLKHEV